MTLKEELQQQWERQYGPYKMRVYVAGSYQFREAIAELVKKIQTHIPDFESTSTWITQGEEATELSAQGYQHFIDLDVEDIRRADVLLLINDASMSKDSTGKWVELGLAMAMNKMIVVWGGAQDSLFVHGDTVVQIHSANLRELITGLQIIHKVRKELYARRTVVGATELRGGGPATQHKHQAGGEVSGVGIQPAEGRSLHDLDRAFADRTQGLTRDSSPADAKYTEVGTPISQVEP